MVIVVVMVMAVVGLGGLFYSRLINDTSRAQVFLRLGLFREGGLEEAISC